MCKPSWFTLLSALLIVSTSDIEAGQKKDAAKAESVQVEKPMMPSGAPEELKALHWLDGDWDVTEKVKSKEDGSWMEQKGSVSYRIILDGGAVEETYTGTWDTKPVQAITWYTYNRMDKTFEMTTLNSYSAKVFTMGKGELKDGVLTVYAEKKWEDKVIQLRWSLTQVDEDHFNVKMEHQKEGKWEVSASEVYSRK